MNRLWNLLVSLAFLPITAQAQIEVKELPSRPGVTVRFAYVKAETPIASAVLFQGGAGAIGIYPNGSMRVENFLSGGAHRFTSNGISVAIPDVPSDRRTLDDFRGTLEHAQDNAVMIDFLRQQAAVPVWLIGTSNGSLSAAATAAHLKGKGPDGVILTASTTRAPVSQAHSVLTAPLGGISLPVLIVHHKQDACYVTPFSAMPELIAALSSAKPVELITIEGGTNNGKPCHSGHHQFQGIEASVTKNIADWIKHSQMTTRQ